MNLLIVESPAKCKTIKKFLGEGYEVLASYGHLRDLSKDKCFFGIDLNDNFHPYYTILPGKSKYITALKTAMKFCKNVIIATDDDREGEAIGWHLTQILKLDPTTNPRITFREITKKAVVEALEKPGTLNMNLVYSQQGRQVLDKLVGFELSPVLWKHISSGMNLSAGRVQSVVTKLVIDREKEIEGFQSKSFYRVNGQFRVVGVTGNENGDQDVWLTNKIFGELDKKLEGLDQSQEFLEKCLGGLFKIADIVIKEEERNPRAPFITSTLQQEAGSRLGFSTKQTMMTAQKLYEKGFITYMRTDSTSISKDFQVEIKKYIENLYGADYVRLKQYKSKVKGGQDAHECIRPTDVTKIWLEGSCPDAEKKLYRIIWQRTVASQMAAQKVEVLTLKIGIFTDKDKLKEEFKSKFEKELFPGFKVLYKNSLNELEVADDSDAEGDINGMTGSDKGIYDTFAKKLVIGQELKYIEITASEKFTEPPARYSEATLVKTLESNGIGRPSTYASMVSKIQERQYVIKDSRPSEEKPILILRIGNGESNDNGDGNTSGKFKEEKNGVKHFEAVWKTRAEKNKLYPTDIGKIVTEFLIEHFDKIMDYEFTSKMEEKLDVVANGDEVWSNVVKEYYDSFHPKVMLLKDAKTSGVLEGGETKAKDKHTRLLGVHPTKGENIYVTLARYGPCLRIGDVPKKADYVSLGKGYSMDKVTLEDALNIMQYPKDLGEYEGINVKIKKGPYGFYLERGKERVSIPKDEQVEEIDLERAKTLIQEKGKQSYILANFEDNGEVIQILKGKFGPYIKKSGKNISVKGRTEEDIQKLTLEEVKEIINDYIVNGPKRGGRKGGGKKKTITAVKKTTTCKKIPTKKSSENNDGEKVKVSVVKKIPSIKKKVES